LPIVQIRPDLPTFLSHNPHRSSRSRPSTSSYQLFYWSHRCIFFLAFEMLNPHSPNVYISTNLAKNNAIQTANSKLYEHLPKTYPPPSIFLCVGNLTDVNRLNCKVCGNDKPVQAFSKTQLLKAAPSGNPLHLRPPNSHRPHQLLGF